MYERFRKSLGKADRLKRLIHISRENTRPREEKEHQGGKSWKWERSKH